MKNIKTLITKDFIADKVTIPPFFMRYVCCFLIAILLFGCGNKNEPEQEEEWKDFPEKLFLSYAPYYENQQLRFANENKEGEYVDFLVCSSKYVTEPEQMGSELIKAQRYGRYVKMTSSEPYPPLRFNYEWYSDASGSSYTYRMSLVYAQVWYDNDPKSSQKREDIYNYLTDTICLKEIADDYDNYAYVVAGKGIVELKLDKKKYILVEE